MSTQEETSTPSELLIKRPPLRFHETQTILQALGEHLEGDLITYWNNPRGTVCHSDVIALYHLLSAHGGGKRVNIFIKSDGGNGQASLRMVSLLREYYEQVVALVPLECASAATMLALGADEIHMGPMAYLTSVDTSLTHDLSPIDRDNDRVSVSLDELKRVIHLWQAQKDNESSNPYKSLFEYVHPLVIGAVDRAESLSMMLCEQILSYHCKNESQIKQIASALNSAYPSHSYPILKKEARRVGLNIIDMDTKVLNLLLELHQLYSDMGRKCTTDFDEIRSHTNEIVNIWESTGRMVFYEIDKDWFYREEERRWITMNDNGGWRKMSIRDGELVKEEMPLA
jgi:hypothetical protein